jgi:hypothetical protein
MSELRLTTTMVREWPRHMLALNKTLLRRFLEQPMRANKIPADEREEWIRREHDARIKAIFAYYSVPDILDERDQWQQLALHLAGEVFAGCRTIRIGQGGRPKQDENPKNHLLQLFNECKGRHPGHSDTAIADILLKKHKDACTAAKLNKPRSLANAMRRMGQTNTDTETAR